MDEECSSLHQSIHLKYFNKRQRFKSDSDHILKKRVPPRDAKRPNDVYITNNSDFKGQFSRCTRFLEAGESEIVLYGLGAAIPRAINLALQLEAKFSGSYNFDVNTNTIHLVDDLESVSNVHDHRIQTRSNSCVKIRVVKSH